MIEVYDITIRVKVDRTEEDRPDSWDWCSVVDGWASPKTDSERLVASFSTLDEFYDALDSGVLS